MLLKACLNGARRAGSHPSLPTTPAELAREGAAAVDAGAGALHVHPRDEYGRESLGHGDVAAVLEVMRDHVDVPIGVTTGAWVVPDLSERLDAVSKWKVLPDFASVNFQEDGAVAIAKLLLQRGVGVEAGIWTAATASILRESGLAESCLRILIEPMDREAAAAIDTVRAIEAELDGLAVRRLLHGFEATAWLMLDEAGRRGYDTRIGLEDTTQLPDGHPAAGNAELVALARDRLS